MNDYNLTKIFKPKYFSLYSSMNKIKFNIDLDDVAISAPRGPLVVDGEFHCL